FNYSSRGIRIFRVLSGMNASCITVWLGVWLLVLLLAFLYRFSEGLTPVLHPLLKPLGTVTVAAGPWFFSGPIPTTTLIMCVLDLKQFKIFFPVWALFQKGIFAKADLNPSDLPIFYNPGLGHISQILVACHRTGSQSAFSN